MPLNAGEVHRILREKLAAHPDADDAMVEAYRDVMRRLAVEAAGPRPDTAYWKAIVDTVQLGAHLCYFNPGIEGKEPDDLIALRGALAERWLEAYELCAGLLEYLHDNAAKLPPGRYRTEVTQAKYLKSLEFVRGEQPVLAADLLGKGVLIIPARRIMQTDKFSTAVLETLLGEEAYAKFLAAYAEPMATLKSLHGNFHLPATSIN